MIRTFLLALLLVTVQIDPGYGEESVFMNKIPDDFAVPEPENEYDKELIAQIEQVGWYNVHVAEENGFPAYAFSIGHFFKQNHPELIVVGLPPEVAHQLLNIAVVKIVGAKEEIEPYKKYDDFTENLTVAFVPVSLEYYGEYLGYANWYYGALPKPYPAMQMVWPDREGKYPWEQGYDKRFLQLQPILAPMP